MAPGTFSKQALLLALYSMTLLLPHHLHPIQHIATSRDIGDQPVDILLTIEGWDAFINDHDGEEVTRGGPGVPCYLEQKSFKR